MQDLIEAVIAIVMLVSDEEPLAMNQILSNMPGEYETAFQRR